MSAKKKEETAKASPAAGEESAAPKKKGGGKLLIGVFVSLVIIAETTVFFFLVPSGEEVAALAESRLIEAAESKGLIKHDEDTEEFKIVEFDLGAHSAPFIPTGSDRTHRVEFRLFGTLHQKNEAHLKEIYEEKFHRFRNRINLEIRSASLEELHENQLGLLQRRILATSNELLGEAILLSVGFSDYQVIEE
jgi:flagellar basal body-associated protein FliL